MRVAFLLEELGVPYERVILDRAKRENKTPSYLAIHPHGWVPALVDGDVVIHETAAICLYLADRFIDVGLAPPAASRERGAYYQWIIYSVATLEPCITDVYLQLELDPDQRNEAVLRSGRERFATSAQVLTRALEARSFLLGERFCAADVLVGTMLIWAEALGLLHEAPALASYASRIRSRPAFGRS
jgi:glutathione S-transferase